MISISGVHPDSPAKLYVMLANTVLTIRPSNQTNVEGFAYEFRELLEDLLTWFHRRAMES
jgi:hypothetical protein